MRILQCDSCHAGVDDYAHWYNCDIPRTMYELKSVHGSDQETFEGAIICHKCIQKLLHNDMISRKTVLEQIDQWAIGNREYLPANAMHNLTKRIQDI